MKIKPEKGSIIIYTDSFKIFTDVTLGFQVLSIKFDIAMSIPL